MLFFHTLRTPVPLQKKAILDSGATLQIWETVLLSQCSDMLWNECKKWHTAFRFTIPHRSVASIRTVLWLQAKKTVPATSPTGWGWALWFKQPSFLLTCHHQQWSAVSHIGPQSHLWMSAFLQARFSKWLGWWCFARKSILLISLHGVGCFGVIGVKLCKTKKVVVWLQKVLMTLIYWLCIWESVAFCRVAVQSSRSLVAAQLLYPPWP